MEVSSFIPYQKESYEAPIMKRRAETYHLWLEQRRSLRQFSDKPVPKEVIEKLILAGSTAPSGAHKQPWTFCAVSDPEIKKKIRIAAEEEEYKNYHGRMSEDWLKDLEVFETDWNKEFLETAPWLIILFKQTYGLENGEKSKHYYVNESVGLAAGFFLTAVHHAGLVSLTHTPSPMDFLGKVLGRPSNERAFLLMPVGYPPEEALVPDLSRKNLEEVAVFYS
ncbi:MAG: nitroreductase family protein [Bacteroidia bacterium]|nr:nitroreductase family protein [Bacteroidia bacterium]